MVMAPGSWRPLLQLFSSLLISLTAACTPDVAKGTAGQVLHVEGAYRRTNALNETGSRAYNFDVRAGSLKPAPGFRDILGKPFPVPEGATLLALPLQVKNLAAETLNLESDGLELIAPSGAHYGVWDQAIHLSDKSIDGVPVMARAFLETLAGLTVEQQVLFAVPADLAAAPFRLDYKAWSKGASVPIFEIALAPASTSARR